MLLIEQPLDYDDVMDHAVLQRRLRTPVCLDESITSLDRAIDMPEPGELLAIGTTGAYGFSMASTYNARTRPAEVLVDGARAHLARKRERAAELYTGESVLPW